MLTAWKLWIVLAIVCLGCSSKQSELSPPPLADYWQPAIGKYLEYRLDSTVPQNFGLSLAARSYKIKDVVDTTFTDGTGRKSFRVYRSITDTNGLAPYKPSATMTVTPSGKDWIEVVDNNLRFMRLRSPVIEGFSWKGNSFIDVSINSGVFYLEGWTYTYQDVGKPFTVKGKTYDNTITILQINETTPDVPFTVGQYQMKKYSREVYAKGIGLIYKEFLYYTYQPPDAGHPTSYFEDGSYGIKLQLINHN